ncbi:MAG: hypothetical protein KDI06_06910 [Calditrichaeota bacterium]|nr:hypothetical protein [Calditrichota bacterium]
MLARYLTLFMLLCGLTVNAGEDDLSLNQYLWILNQLTPEIHNVGIIVPSEFMADKANLQKISNTAKALNQEAAFSPVSDIKEVAACFQGLQREIKVQAVIVLLGNDALNHSVSKEYLIKNCVLGKVVLLTVGGDWTGGGALMSVSKQADGIVAVNVNAKTYRALKLNFPEALSPKLQVQMSE